MNAIGRISEKDASVFEESGQVIETFFGYLKHEVDIKSGKQ